jgi:toxin ParE1/3/4
MANYILSLEAREDVIGIWLYLSDNASDAIADRQLERIYDSCAKLAENPYTGRSRLELREGLRSFPESPYMIFYTVESLQEITVRRVIHSSRDIDKQFKKD